MSSEPTVADLVAEELKRRGWIARPIFKSIVTINKIVGDIPLTTGADWSPSMCIEGFLVLEYLHGDGFRDEIRATGFYPGEGKLDFTRTPIPEIQDPNFFDKLEQTLAPLKGCKTSQVMIARVCGAWWDGGGPRNSI